MYSYYLLKMPKDFQLHHQSVVGRLDDIVKILHRWPDEHMTPQAVQSTSHKHISHPIYRHILCHNHAQMRYMPLQVRATQHACMLAQSELGAYDTRLCRKPAQTGAAQELYQSTPHYVYYGEYFIVPEHITSV